MVTVDEYARIRQAHRLDKLSIRQLSRRFHHSRRKIRQILAEPEPKPYQRRSLPSILDVFRPVIDAILRQDEEAPRKQRHTVAKLFRRLRDEHGYQGGYERVRYYVQSQRQSARETFIPLDHDPGQRLEADFGHIWVDFPEGRRQVPVLVVTWSYSNCPFALALPSERTEAILHGLVEAFNFFGCVPRELWWDNPKTVAAQLLAGRERRLQERYQALVSHYAFEARFCLVRRPQEKPRVEGRVRHLQRDWATPVPRVADLAELNRHLRTCCVRDGERVQAGQTETIGERFRRDSDNALSLPERPFDPCLVQPARADKYQTVRFENNRYSVPRAAAFQAVTIKVYVAEVAIVLGSQVIARHPRSYGQHEQILDPQHYLSSLQRRPAAVDHAEVFRSWCLPAVYEELRRALEKEYGPRRGVQHYVRLLELLEDHAIEEVARAIERSRTEAGYDLEGLLLRVRGRGPAAPASLDRGQQPASVRDLVMPLPDLQKFNQFLSGEKSHERSECPAAEDESQAVASTDHERGVRGAGASGSDSQRELSAVPATADGGGGGGASGQRAQGADQAGELPLGQGLRQLRLHGPAVAEQGEGTGADERGVDRAALQCLLDRQLGHGQDAPGDGPGPGGLPARLAGALLQCGGPGQSFGGVAEAVPAGALPATAGSC
jgi:transposase